MKKAGFLLIAVLLAVVSIIGVVSYSSAVVESTAQVRIVSTDEALLALKEGGGENEKVLCSIDKDGTMSISFTLTRGSAYVFGQLFRVQNNSADRISFTIENVGEVIQYLYVMPDWPEGSEGLLLPEDLTTNHKDSLMINDAGNRGVYYSLDSGEAVSIGVAFIVPGIVPGNAEETIYSGSLLVKAEAISQ